MSAAYDPIAPPRLGRALAAGIPGARFVEIPDASHGVPIHPPDRINPLLLDHLAEARAGLPISSQGAIMRIHWTAGLLVATTETNPPRESTRQIKDLRVWRRQVDGGWKLSRGMHYRMPDLKSQ